MKRLWLIQLRSLFVLYHLILVGDGRHPPLHIDFGAHAGRARGGQVLAAQIVFSQFLVARTSE